MKCPLVNSSTSPRMLRIRWTTRSARSPTCAGVSPPGAPSRNRSQSGRSRRICAEVSPSYQPTWRDRLHHRYRFGDGSELASLLLSQRLTDFCCCHVISSLVLKESNCKDSAQADGPAQGLPKRAELSPIRPWENVGWISQKPEGQLSGYGEYKYCTNSLSVIHLTREGLNLTKLLSCCLPMQSFLARLPMSDTDGITAGENNTCLRRCQLCLLNY